MKTRLKNYIEKLSDVAYGNVNSSSKSTYRTRKETSEIFLTFKEIYQNFSFDPITKASFGLFFNKIQNAICDEEYFRYYMGFYYLPKRVFEKDGEELSNSIYQSNINISCFRCKMFAADILEFSLGSSADNYFFSRGDKVITAVANYFGHPFDFDISALIYMLLNYFQALLEYGGYKDSQYNNIAYKLREECMALFKIIIKNSAAQDVFISNHQLSSFWNSLLYDILPIKDAGLPSALIKNNRYRWALNALYKYSPNEASKRFNANIGMILDPISDNGFLCLRLLSNELVYRDDIDLTSFEISITNRADDMRVKYDLHHFFNHYSQIRAVNCIDDDIALLNSYDDAALRYKVSQCIKNVDSGELDRQLAKPHGAMEISDLDLRFIEDGITKYLCMPFKTGREIISNTVADSYMYQLIKPFTHFGSQCIVVFITAKKCSQGLETYIQRMSVRQPSWRIEIIQEAQLCKLLKLNGQLV